MSVSRHATVLGVLVVLLAGSHAPYARGRAQTPLATTKRLNCIFLLYATGTWINGEPRAEVKPAKLSFRFESIDTQAGTAEFDNGFSRAHVIARISEGSLHFMHVMTAGPLYTTSVFDTERRAGNLKAVHTRHEYEEISVPGFTSRPEQYYGECELQQ